MAHSILRPAAALTAISLAFAPGGIYPAPAATAQVAPAVAIAAPTPVRAAALQAVKTQAAKTSSASSALLKERLRNTRARFAARFVYVPGVPKFDKLVNREVRAAIRSTKRSYSPQAFPRGAGLGSRGCVAGSVTKWSAKKVMRRAATAPPKGRGTAVTCEVISASGSVIQVAMRTVAGSRTRITRDATRTYYADVRTGAAGKVGALWRSSTPKKLWTAAVAKQIRRAGGSGTDPIADPGKAQLKLARQALAAAKNRSDGDLSARLPAGLVAPELAALGIERTAEPTPVRIDEKTANGWASKVGKLLRGAVGKRFVGVKAKRSSVELDCRLLPCVALTYDDGPGPYTGALLSTMRKREARITLFMVGSRVPARRSIVRRAVVDGHEIGSHTMTHPDLTGLSLGAARAQVRDAAAAIRSASKKRVRIFRPPYGAVNSGIIDAVGMPAILWSVDTEDWKRPGERALIARSVPVVKPGGIILFHDIHPDSVNVANSVVSGLRDRGFELVTVSQLFGGKVPVKRITSRG
ncbi:polysaccharide deacetylase family protein [Leucobacter soli]|uniref:NodB homology domain-containing protein n=1 Tax=Leucobacter soli TaxID=2812850 RepID=A0A916K195_9MICO|nr:polysaccharide deacetylase family protein [Leucobacter soli]CAG7613510.1 hypothetical protein LEUCIP111803_01704 [Leucobacter soli]